MLLLQSERCDAVALLGTIVLCPAIQVPSPPPPRHRHPSTAASPAASHLKSLISRAAFTWPQIMSHPAWIQPATGFGEAVLTSRECGSRSTRALYVYLRLYYYTATICHYRVLAKVTPMCPSRQGGISDSPHPINNPSNAEHEPWALSMLVVIMNVPKTCPCMPPCS